MYIIIENMGPDMKEVQKKFFICLLLIAFATLFPSIAVSDKAKSPSDEETKEYYQTLLQAINLINFSLQHIYYNYNNDMINAGYFYILDNIDLNKVSFPGEIKDTYQEIINFFSNSGGATEKQTGMEFLEKQNYRNLNILIQEAVSNLKNGNREVPFSLMEYSKILYLRFLLDNQLNPSRNEKNEEIRDRILYLIKKWLAVIRPYFDNQILPILPDAYLMENEDITFLLRNFYIRNKEICLQSLNELQNIDKRIHKIPIYLLLYTFLTMRVGDREQTELYINKFLECYRSILKKDIFLEIFYIGKLENLFQKDPELKNENIKQQMLTTAETACKYVNDKNVIYKIFISAIFYRLGKIDKTKELLSGINPEFIDKENKCEHNFYRLAMYDLEHGYDILDHMILLSKVLKMDLCTIEQLEEIKDSKIPEVLFLLGRNYIYTIENKDLEKGLAYIEEAHKLGCIEATYRLAYLYMYGDKWGIKKDEKKGFAYFQILAEKGEREAFCELGKCYYEGKVVPQDFNKARECFEKAGRNGEYWLGLMYSKGDGVPQDYQKAHEYFFNVVREDYRGYGTYGPYIGKAYIALGDLYLTGKIDVVNYIKAMEYYQRVSRYPEAQFKMGYIYENGYEIQKSYTKAKECYENAGKEGNLDALLRLGDFYLYGLAGKKDYMLSYAYYTLVIRLAKEDPDYPRAEELAQQAEQARKKLLPRIWNLWSGLTPEEVKEAEDIANSWKYGSFLTKKGT